MTRPLSPEQLFPAGSRDISQRFLALSTGVRVRIAESGPANGKPVVMLPGWGATIYMYRHALDILARRGLRVIAIDLRGFGLSDRPHRPGAYSLDAYLGDLLDALDALGLSRPALVGQSMGGGLAMHFGLRFPERISKLVLINPTGLIPLRFLPIVRMLPPPVAAWADRRLVPRQVVNLILRRLVYADASKVSERDVDEYWAPTQLPGYVAAARAALGEFDWKPVSNALASSLAVPTMVLIGAQDRLVTNTERAARRLKGAEVHVLPGGHCVQEETPRESYGLIAELVAR